MAREFDVVVIGGGAAGLSAAMELQRKGREAVMINDGRIGGDCTFTGCIPSKTLLSAARNGAAFADAMARVRKTIDRVAEDEQAPALAERGIEVIDGRARFPEHRVLDVNGERFTFRAMILGLGAEVAVPPIPGLADVPYLTSETVFELTERPASLAILGGGPIGCELAQAFARLGTEVTVIEMVHRIMPRDDVDAARAVRRALEADGVTIRVGAGATQVRNSSGEVVISLADGTDVSASHVLIATGRRAPAAFAELQDVGVDLTRRGFIKVDDKMQTSVADVYAAGDCTGELQFTHAAAEMARVAVAQAAPDPVDRVMRPRWNPQVVPWTTFTEPEVAQVGLTEHQASKIRGAKVAHFPMSALDRARTEGDEDGFVKLMTAPKRVLRRAGGGQLVGATVVCGRAGELIAEPTLALRNGMFAGRLAESTHAYPTWGMAIQQAAGLLWGRGDGEVRSPRIEQLADS